MILVVSELGWVDFDLRCSLGWWAASVATYCPSRMVEHLKMKQPNPTVRQPESSCTSLTFHCLRYLIRKIELFGRPHNVNPNWVTLGNQLDGIVIHDEEMLSRFNEVYPDGYEIVKDTH